MSLNTNRGNMRNKFRKLRVRQPNQNEGFGLKVNVPSRLSALTSRSHNHTKGGEEMKKYISHNSAWLSLEKGEITLNDKVVIHDKVHYFEEQEENYIMIEESPYAGLRNEGVRHGTSYRQSYGRNRIAHLLSE